MQTRQIARYLARHSTVIVVATMLLASAPSFAAQDAPTPASGSMVGEYTGQVVDGRPVYRLPSITVRASRKAELARISAEERRASAHVTETHRALAKSQPRALHVTQTQRVHVAAQ